MAQPPQDFDKFQAELLKKEQEAIAQGKPFNKTAYIKRIAQGRQTYYDSAEYVLRNGINNQQQAPAENAVFDKDKHPNEQQPKQQPAGLSKFAKNQNTNVDDDDDE